MTSRNDRAEGVLLGTAAGDALGAPYEFQPPRGAELPVEMTGGGPWESAPAVVPGVSPKAATTKGASQVPFSATVHRPSTQVSPAAQSASAAQATGAGSQVPATQISPTAQSSSARHSAGGASQGPGLTDRV